MITYDIKIMKRILLILTMLCAGVFSYASFIYSNGAFSVTESSSVSINKINNFGGIKSFGYYTFKVENGKQVITGQSLLQFDANGNANIENLAAGTNFSFYAVKANDKITYGQEIIKHGTALDILGYNPGTNDPIYSMSNGNNINAGLHFTMESTKAPAGQPLPGIITTALICIAGTGAFFGLRRRARK